MRTRVLFCVVLAAVLGACSASPTAPTSHSPSSPRFDTDTTAAAPGPHGSGSGG